MRDTNLRKPGDEGTYSVSEDDLRASMPSSSKYIETTTRIINSISDSEVFIGDKIRKVIRLELQIKFFATILQIISASSLSVLLYNAIPTEMLRWLSGLLGLSSALISTYFMYLLDPEKKQCYLELHSQMVLFLKKYKVMAMRRKVTEDDADEIYRQYKDFGILAQKVDIKLSTFGVIEGEVRERNASFDTIKKVFETINTPNRITPITVIIGIILILWFFLTSFDKWAN